MKNIAFTLSLLLSPLGICEERVVETVTRIKSEAGDVHDVYHNGQRFDLIPQKNFSYRSFAFTTDGKVVYVIAIDHRQKRSSMNRTIKRIVLSEYNADPRNYIPTDVPFHCDLEYCPIIALFSVSEERGRLLLEINRTIFTGEGTQRHKTHPYFLDLSTGKLQIVKP